jgi:hypothetical protein
MGVAPDVNSGNECERNYSTPSGLNPFIASLPPGCHPGLFTFVPFGDILIYFRHKYENRGHRRRGDGKCDWRIAGQGRE